MINKDDFTKIKKLSILSLVSDEILMNKLVLKGGTCLELAYQINSRSSKDIDFSIDTEFTDEEIEQVKSNLPKVFNARFNDIGYYVFDFKITNKPIHVPLNVKMSGYNLSFKICTLDIYEQFNDNLQKLRDRAINLGQSNKKDFVIDISKYEYVQNKEQMEIDGCCIYVYPPVMMICEKLRAICQKMKEYRNTEGDLDLPRARDFWDIFLIQENLKPVDFKLPENRTILQHVFEAKDVDMNLLLKVEEKRHIHEGDFRNVQLTDSFNKKYPTHFDYYFEYVLDLINDLEKFWVK
ncbi:MAG: nucleotidyl transferase AbiEii/AbiGii toxin family protein [Candidatus Gastranaerophilales bacterium]|nr:nucleotidyl transferase AbiEii/AbiGii toxin family protein [Candidatus Gastranaerophilales bacterium]